MQILVQVGERTIQLPMLPDFGAGEATHEPGLGWRRAELRGRDTEEGDGASREDAVSGWELRWKVVE